MPGSSFGACPLRAHVDPRLLRFSAGATASVLAVVLLIVDIARPLGLGLLASQVAVFAFTAFVSFQWSLWAQIFARYSKNFGFSNSPTSAASWFAASACSSGSAPGAK